MNLWCQMKPSLLVICAGYRSSAKHYGQPLPQMCVQHFLYENGAQFYLYLISRFVLGQGSGASKEINQNSLFVIWQCSNFSCLGLLTSRCKSRKFHETIFVFKKEQKLQVQFVSFALYSHVMLDSFVTSCQSVPGKFSQT